MWTGQNSETCSKRSKHDCNVWVHIFILKYCLIGSIRFIMTVLFVLRMSTSFWKWEMLEPPLPLHSLPGTKGIKKQSRGDDHDDDMINDVNIIYIYMYDYMIAVSNYVDEWWINRSIIDLRTSKSFPEMTEELTGNVSDRVQRLVILNKAQFNGFSTVKPKPSKPNIINIARQIWSHLTWA